jgi:hypothetical protein
MTCESMTCESMTCESMFQRLDTQMSNAQLTKHSFMDFIKDKKKYKESNAELTIFTLNEFMECYEHQLGYDCGYLLKDSKNGSRYQLYLLTDTSVDKTHTMIPEMRKKYRKCGKERRMRLDEKYNYDKNPLNRVHAYLSVEHSPGESDDKTLAINIICSSNYSDIKGVGSYMMKTLISIARNVGYKNIVLEVGSDQMEECMGKLVQEEEYEEESEEESEEEYEEESEEESEEEYEEESEEEYDEYEQLREDFSDYVSECLWKKSVRHTNGIPYYSFGEEYLKEIILDNLENEESEQVLPIIKTDDEYGYNGYYYHKAKRHSKKLLDYYYHWGFIEDSKVHKEWRCFSELAFPSLRLEL